MPEDHAAVPGIADMQSSEWLRTGRRVGRPHSEVTANLGLLAELQGSWRGTGFNITPRPFFGSAPPFFLELNATQETLDVTAITGDIPNRGSRQPDVTLHGLRYLQQVTDAVTNSGLHIEPGLWLRIPATTDPVSGPTYVRQAVVPHGDSLLAQSVFARRVTGFPTIDPVDSTPFRGSAIAGLTGRPVDPVTDAHYLAQYRDGVLPPVGLPPGLDAARTIKDPTQVLLAQIDGQTIISTVAIGLSTAAPAGGILNIPFVTTNANAVQMDAIVWIETVKHSDGGHFMQLQYLQRVILDFDAIRWPHVSLATLVRL
ncbi:heme-binding protein [Rhodopila sp.]|uniref:heme-binding protein n=1 Tax=Rhodopila sp. TaxID=2480087 RepID=UPI003D10FDCB